ncbi:MAG TPA: hypothetical protein VH437_15810 [Terriglobales bacterium]|jgi:hypothetical protein
MPNETIQVRLPQELCNEVLRQFGSRFADIEEFVTFVLHECVRAEALKMDEQEERILQNRLKDLGYI